jgi:hypothetical protein
MLAAFMQSDRRGGDRLEALRRIGRADPRQTDRRIEGVLTNVLNKTQAYLLVCSLAIVLQPIRGFTQQNSNPPTSSLGPTSREHDGQRDFDFSHGVWKTHIARRLHPLTGSDTWVEYEGTSIVRKIWNGRGSLGETEADGPAGHLEALSLRLYNPEARQWNLSYASGTSGTLSVPTIGEFSNGRGEFFDTEPLNGRSILVRNVWSEITSNSCHFEQAFSDDGGKTWEVNWRATDTRVTNEAAAEKTTLQPTPAGPDGQRDFDFELGSWKIHLKRLPHPLTGSTTWVEFDGTSVTRKIWDGRAQIEEFETESPAGRIEGLTLRLYNPQTRQWSLYWANSKDGTVVAPQIGRFKNGQGEFFGQDTLNDKPIFIRFVWSNPATDSPHFEQSFSEDGGKTWELNWVTEQTRVADESDKMH